MKQTEREITHFKHSRRPIRPTKGAIIVLVLEGASWSTVGSFRDHGRLVSCDGKGQSFSPLTLTDIQPLPICSDEIDFANWKKPQSSPVVLWFFKLFLDLGPHPPPLKKTIMIQCRYLYACKEQLKKSLEFRNVQILQVLNVDELASTVAPWQ